MKILVTDPVDPWCIEELRRRGFDVDERYGLTKEQLKQVIGQYDALVVRSRTKVTSEIIEEARNLKVIARAGVGLDNIDVEKAKEKGILVINTPGAPTTAVAELALALMLSVLRSIPSADRSMKEGKWEKKKYVGRELSGKKVGIIGFGRIGRKLASLLKPFDVELYVYDRYVSEDVIRKYNAIFCGSLEELLPKVDILSIHVPLTPETRNMIGEKEIRMMKKGAVLINTARGGIVDEKALLKALKDGHLSGAALDVFEIEPPTNLELVKLPNVVTTPHIGGQTVEAQRRIGEALVAKLEEALKRS